VFYLAEVLYDDPTLRLDRATSAEATPALFDRYFAVFAFDGWHVTKIR
jgi:hypothetical protein